VNAIALLRNQHAELEALFVRSLTTPPPDRQAIVLAIGDRFEAHAVVEEHLVYATFATGHAAHVLDDYARDHQRIRDLLATLCENPYRATTDALDDLRMIVHHHEIEDEEAQLFPLIERTLSASQLDQLGADSYVLYAEVMEHSPWRALHPDAHRVTRL
jgi:hypothetical protein